MCGLPVVISDGVNTHRELESAGIATVVRRSVDSVVMGVESVLGDASARSRLAAAGPAFVNTRYTWDAIVPDVIARTKPSLRELAAWFPAAHEDHRHGLSGVHRVCVRASHGAGTRAYTVGVDNLSRRGATKNLRWLEQHVSNHTFERLDVTSAAEMDDFIHRHADAAALVHLAAQTAVTTSVDAPRHDFETNALGTLNVLEAVRRRAPSCRCCMRPRTRCMGTLRTSGCGDAVNDTNSFARRTE